MAPKKGGKKLSLGEFLGGQSSGKLDWADDVFDLPTAPSAKPEGSFGGSSLDFAPDRKDRDAWGGGFGAREHHESRPDVPLPTAPPFTAFIGSMSFDSTDADLAGYFHDLPVTSIRIVTEGFTGKSRGFGYVEFATLDALKDALSRTGGQITGRAVRISVAEPPRTGGFTSAADDASQWRRAGPVPSSGRPAHGGFGAAGGDDLVLDRSAFGSKFNQDAGAPRGNRFGGSDFDPHAGDEAANWRTGKAVEARHNRQFSRGPSAGDDVVLDRSAFGQKVTQAPPAREERSSRGFGLARQSQDSDITLDRSAFGSKVVEAPSRRGGFERRGSREPTSPSSPAEEGPWRRAAPLPPKKHEREHLKLKPRSSDLPPVGSEAQHHSSKPSPFGAAKPVDNSEREREIAARLDERRKAERQQRKQQHKNSAKPSESGSQAAESQASESQAGDAPEAREATEDASASDAKNLPDNSWQSVPSKKAAATPAKAQAPAKEESAEPKPAAGQTPFSALATEGTEELEEKLDETKLE